MWNHNHCLSYYVDMFLTTLMALGAMLHMALAFVTIVATIVIRLDRDLMVFTLLVFKF